MSSSYRRACNCLVPKLTDRVGWVWLIGKGGLLANGGSVGPVAGLGGEGGSRLGY